VLHYFHAEEREKSSYLFENTICDFISISAEMLLDSNNTNVKKVQIDSTLHSKTSQTPLSYKLKPLILRKHLLITIVPLLSPIPEDMIKIGVPVTN
jgi:hypothetical protein